MTAGYGVTPQQVLDGSNNAAATAEEIATGLSQLRTYVASLRGVWEGVAHLNFDQLMLRWDTDAKNLNDALVGISTDLKGTYQNYVTTEAANDQTVAAVAAIMPPARLG